MWRPVVVEETARPRKAACAAHRVAVRGQHHPPPAEPVRGHAAEQQEDHLGAATPAAITQPRPVAFPPPSSTAKATAGVDIGRTEQRGGRIRR